MPFQHRRRVVDHHPTPTAFLLPSTHASPVQGSSTDADDLKEIVESNEILLVVGVKTEKIVKTVEPDERILATA